MLTAPERVVLIFGLGGSGKSSLARALGNALHLRVVHPSSLLRDLMLGRRPETGETRCNDGFWESPQGREWLHRRVESDCPPDLEANRILLQEVERGQVVIDSWSLPWLTRRGLRIHLQAPLEVRAQRAAARAGLSLEQARQALEEKDQDTRHLFLRHYGFDIFRDWEIFDLTLESGQLDLEELTRQSLSFVRQAWKSRSPDFQREPP